MAQPSIRLQYLECHCPKRWVHFLSLQELTGDGRDLQQGKLSFGFGTVCFVPAFHPFKQFWSSLVFVARRPRIVLIIDEKQLPSPNCLLYRKGHIKKKIDQIWKTLFQALKIAWSWCFTTWKAILRLPYSFHLWVWMKKEVHASHHTAQQATCTKQVLWCRVNINSQP